MTTPDSVNPRIKATSPLNIFVYCVERDASRRRYCQKQRIDVGDPE